MTESRPGAEIELRGISKTFDGTRALRDVSLRLERGKIYALLGGNGSGKSTLIKILAAVYQADPGGTVTVAGESIDADAITAGWSRAHNLRFVHQDLGLASPLSVVENMLAQAQYPRRATGAINWSRATKHVQERLDALDIDVRADAMMADLGPSKRTMVAIARALQDLDTTKPGVLVLDEPTAKLAAPEVSYLLERLQTLARGGLTIIYVSHRTEETLAIADEAIVLRDGQLVAQQPMAGLSESDLVRLVVGHPVDAHPGATRADRVAAREAQVVLQTTDLAGGALRGLSLTVCAGEVVGLAGLDGSGRTSLMKLVFGAEHPTAGHIEIRGHRLTAGSIAAARSAGIAYVPEDRLADFMFPTLSVADNAAAATVGRFRRPLGFHRREQRAFAERVIADFAVRTSSVDAMISSLSGGNQQKVAIARALATEPSLLLVDEPTQGVDVRARADLHKALRRAADGGVAALVASADLNELCEISDRIIVLFRGKAIAERIGTAINPHEIGNLVYGGDVVSD